MTKMSNEKILLQFFAAHPDKAINSMLCKDVLDVARMAYVSDATPESSETSNCKAIINRFVEAGLVAYAFSATVKRPKAYRDNENSYSGKTQFYQITEKGQCEANEMLKQGDLSMEGILNSYVEKLQDVRRSYFEFQQELKPDEDQETTLIRLLQMHYPRSFSYENIYCKDKSSWIKYTGSVKPRDFENIISQDGEITPPDLLNQEGMSLSKIKYPDGSTSFQTQLANIPLVNQMTPKDQPAEAAVERAEEEMRNMDLRGWAKAIASTMFPDENRGGSLRK